MNSSVRGGSGCSGGGNVGSGGSSSSAWRDAAPGVMAARAAEERARTWDAQNGLEIDELEAARASCEPEGDDDSDDEVTEGRICRRARLGTAVDAAAAPMPEAAARCH